MIRDSIRWLYGLETFGVKLGLESIQALLDLLGRPDRAYPCVLVGGTNGKGSVAAMLDGILAASGLRAGLYTSPHLVRPNERIRIAGGDVSMHDLCRALDLVRRACEDGLERGAFRAHPSFFEVMTAAALDAFREAGVEVAVLEVGLGGRLDATNAVEAVLPILVTVDLDHTDRLGSTLEAIAAEKAGIVKPGRPLVCGVEQEEALGPIRRACEAAGAPLVEVRRVAEVEPGPGAVFTVRAERALYEDLRLPLLGEHQRHNAAVAIVAFERLARALGFEAEPTAVRRGLREVRWPGRLQWIPGHPPLLLDGAHNPAGAEALAEYLRGLRGPRTVAVLGALKEKDFAGMLDRLAPEVATVVLTRSSVARAADPEDLRDAAERFDLRVEVEPDLPRALERARALAGPDGLVLVTGSLYLVGDVLALLEGRPSPGPIAL